MLKSTSSTKRWLSSLKSEFVLCFGSVSECFTYDTCIGSTHCFVLSGVLSGISHVAYAD